MADNPRCERCDKPRSEHNYFGGWGYLCHNGSNTFKAPPTLASSPTAADLDKDAEIAEKGQATSLPIDEIIRQLRLGPSASNVADDHLMSDAADFICEYWDRFQREKRANLPLVERLAALTQGKD